MWEITVAIFLFATSKAVLLFVCRELCCMYRRRRSHLKQWIIHNDYTHSLRRYIDSNSFVYFTCFLCLSKLFVHNEIMHRTGLWRSISSQWDHNMQCMSSVCVSKWSRRRRRRRRNCQEFESIFNFTFFLVRVHV